MKLYLLVLFLCLDKCVQEAKAADFSYSIESGPDDEEDDLVWEEPMLWDNDVYTGRHFNELVSSFTGDHQIVNRHTLLVFYDDDSYDDIQSYGLTTNGLPKSKFLNYVKYNIRSSPRHIWYPLVGVDDLAERYIDKADVLRNPRVFFFSAGSSLEEPTEFPIEYFEPEENSGDFKLWVWDQLKVKLLISNKLGEEVRVKQYGEMPDNNPIAIDEGHNVLLDTHISAIITVTALDSRLVYAVLVEQGMEDMTIDIDQQNLEQFSGLTEEQWLTQTNERMQAETSLTLQYAEYMAENYLRQFKQPALIGKYSQLGYLIQAIPEELLQSLLNFYDNSQDSRERGCILADGTRNGGEIECTTIPIPLQGKLELGEKLKILLEDWCGKILEMTHVYGINEYWDNSLRMQTLGKVTDHVISAELVIKKDLREQGDWELEILNHKGQVEYTYLNEGMMIMYESSSVPIKRPRPFLGRSYVTIVVHYRPRIGWPWKLAAEDLVLSDGHAWENLKLFNTPGTFRKDGERAASPPVHAEL